jgi:hypothetical protein
VLVVDDRAVHALGVPQRDVVVVHNSNDVRVHQRAGGELREVGVEREEHEHGPALFASSTLGLLPALCPLEFAAAACREFPHGSRFPLLLTEGHESKRLPDLHQLGEHFGEPISRSEEGDREEEALAGDVALLNAMGLVACDLVEGEPGVRHAVDDDIEGRDVLVPGVVPDAREDGITALDEVGLVFGQGLGAHGQLNRSLG